MIPPGFRRYHDGNSPLESVTRARWVAGAGVADFLLFVLVYLGIAVAVASMDRLTLFNRPPAWFKLVFVVPTLGAVATAGAVACAGRARLQDDWLLATRVHYSAVVAAATALY